MSGRSADRLVGEKANFIVDLGKTSALEGGHTRVKSAEKLDKERVFV